MPPVCKINDGFYDVYTEILSRCAVELFVSIFLNFQLQMNVNNIIFIHLKLKLLSQFPASNEWKILLCMKNRRLPNLNYWINWAATTNYFRKLNDISIGINMPDTVYVGSSITRVTTGGYGAIRVYYVIMGIVLAWDMSVSARGSTFDVRFWRLKSIPALKELQMYNSHRPLT